MNRDNYQSACGSSVTAENDSIQKVALLQRVSETLTLRKYLPLFSLRCILSVLQYCQFQIVLDIVFSQGALTLPTIGETPIISSVRKLPLRERKLGCIVHSYK